MSTPHVHDALDAYVDGELDPARREAVDTHLAGCATCRAELEARRALERGLATQAVPDPGARYWAEFSTRVETRLRPEPELPRAYERLTGWLFPAGRFAWPRAAGALVACTLVVYVGMRGFNPERAAMHPPAGSPAPEAAPAPAPPGAELVPKSEAPPVNDRAAGAATNAALDRKATDAAPVHGAEKPTVVGMPEPASPAPAVLSETPPSPPKPGVVVTPAAPRPDAPALAPGPLDLGLPPGQGAGTFVQPPSSADPAARFVLAAVAGDTAAARVIAARGGGHE